MNNGPFYDAVITSQNKEAGRGLREFLLEKVQQEYPFALVVNGLSGRAYEGICGDLETSGDDNDGRSSFGSNQSPEHMEK